MNQGELIRGRLFRRLLLAVVGLSLLAACSGQSASSSNDTPGAGQPSRLILGAYTTPREAYAEIIPLFQAAWKAETGQDVVFEESYLGSGAQSRAVVEGFEADVIALSLEADVARIVNAGLITHDWHAVAYNGMVSTSIVVFGVRAGNPENIQDWHDLARPGVEVLTPNPQTSGGAMWNILSAYGAALRGHVQGVPADDPAAAEAFLEAVLRNVTVMDKGARESITNFEQGVGDVIITYENEILVGQKAGQDYEMILPQSSILIENPVAVVDASVEAHGSRAVAAAFVNFLFSTEAQTIFARYGLRSPDPAVAADTADRYPALADQFTIGYFGGWDKATPDFFGEAGLYSRVIGAVQGQ
jgi:sulfate transport system substrate-binding protein